jgi:hypothetical protein
MRRVIVVMLIVLATGVAGLVTARARTTTPGHGTPGRAGDAEGAGACGVERWRVKTLRDADAGRVDFTPRSASVDGLRARRPPRSLTERRGRGFERMTFRVRADLVVMKREKDSDIHLVIAQPGEPTHTMIVEFPAAACTHGASRTARARMARAHRAIDRACGTASGSFRQLHGQATVTGVGFWDFPHGQRGVAPNAVELHPVTAFSSSNCR